MWGGPIVVASEKAKGKSSISSTHGPFPNLSPIFLQLRLYRKPGFLAPLKYNKIPFPSPLGWHQRNTIEESGFLSSLVMNKTILPWCCGSHMGSINNSFYPSQLEWYVSIETQWGAWPSNSFYLLLAKRTSSAHSSPTPSTDAELNLNLEIMR